jgi:hypothetical protein
MKSSHAQKRNESRPDLNRVAHQLQAGQTAHQVSTLSRC